MPKMSAATGKKIAKEEAAEPGGTLEPLEPGRYGPFRLVSVDVKDGTEYPYWAWKYTLVEPIPGRYNDQFTNTSMSPESLRFFKAHLLGHGLSDKDIAAGVDTDELLGDLVMLTVRTRTIQRGNRAGELTNEVVMVEPYSPDDDEDKEDGEEPF